MRHSVVSFILNARLPRMAIQAGLLLKRRSNGSGTAYEPPSSGGHEDFGLKILDRYQCPLFVIDERAALVFKNRAAARVLEARSGFHESNGRLRLGAKADAALRRIIAGCQSSGEAHNECYGMQLASTLPRDWLLFIRPLERSGDDEPAMRTFLLHAVGRTRPRAAPARTLQALFGLTARETTVIAELLRSGTLETIARRLALSQETVRSHLKRTFRKCNVHSKAELLLLLQSAAAFETEAP